MSDMGFLQLATSNGPSINRDNALHLRAVLILTS